MAASSDGKRVVLDVKPRSPVIFFVPPKDENLEPPESQMLAKENDALTAKKSSKKANLELDPKAMELYVTKDKSDNDEKCKEQETTMIDMGKRKRKKQRTVIVNQSESDSDSSEGSDTDDRKDIEEADMSKEREIQDDDEMPYEGYVPVVFRCLTQHTAPRKQCLRLITWPWFERISMGVILLNCITLGMYQPCEDVVCQTSRCKILEVFDHCIFVFFTVEMIIKIIAMGLYGKEQYLAETWNRLDMFIVFAGALEYALNTENLSLSAIRTIRVLRPLRAINRIPSMRILVMLLLDTLPMLGNVLLLCFFVFFIFGIIGVQLWAGMLRQRCFIELPPNVTKPPELSNYFMNGALRDKDYICAMEGETGMSKCHVEDSPEQHLPRFQTLSGHCNESAVPFTTNEPTETSCVNWNQYYTNCSPLAPNPFQGSISFDNIGLAWVAIFQVISLEGWVDIMYLIQDAHSFWDWAYFVLLIVVISLAGWVNIMYYVQDAHSFWDFIYFVSLIVIGAFFMINLCLVVIATQFSETKKRETERMRLERKRFHSSSTLASLSEPGGCYDEIIKYIAHLWRRAKRKVKRKFNLNCHTAQARRMRKVTPEKAISLRRNKRRKKLQTVHLHHHHHHHHHHYHISGNLRNTETCSLRAPRASPEVSDIDTSSPRRPTFLSVPSTDVSAHHSQESLHTSNDRLGKMPIANAHNHQSVSIPLSQQPNQLQQTNEKSDSGLHCANAYGLLQPLPSTGHSELSNPAIVSPLKRASSLKMQRTRNEEHTYRKNSHGAISCHVGRKETPNRLGIPVSDILALQGAKSAAFAAPYDLASDESADKNTLHLPTVLPPAIQQGDKLSQLPGRGALSCALRDVEAHHHCVSHSHCSEYEYTATDATDDSSTDFEEEDRKRRQKRKEANPWRRFRKCVKRIVDNKYFQRGIWLAILINTLSMGVEYHNQPESLTQALEYSNIFFSCLFAFEMLLKIIAEGPFGYIKNGFNVFDGFIVVLSLVEISQRGSGGLSVLRTFRLLRILKLVRFMPALRYQLVIMLRTMDNVATFFALLILFIFIFSVLGMHLFGGKFSTNVATGQPCSCADINNSTILCRRERKNFDSLLWSLVTVFQILTQEDWNEVLYNGMSRTSPWAALYFIALMTFGNYVLFNLLVAILVEGFSTDSDDKGSKNSDQNSKERELKELEKEDKKNLKNKEINKMIEDRELLLKMCKCQINGNYVGLTKVDSAEDIKNNQEKEKKLFGSPPSISIPKEEKENNTIGLCDTPGGNGTSSVPLNPPIITHTAATPMPTPQGSPNEIGSSSINDEKNTLGVEAAFVASNTSLDTIDKSLNTSMGSVRSGSRLSPRFQRKDSRGSWLARFGNRSESQSDSGDEDYNQNQKRDRSANYRDCNGHTQLNNQRTLTAQSSVQSYKSLGSCHSSRQRYLLGRQNSFGNRSLCSRRNSIGLSRQNSFNSTRSTLSPQTSFGSSPREDYKQNNLSDPPERLDDEEYSSEDDIQCGCSWCPEPTGCVLQRIDYALFIFTPENRLRHLCVTLINKRWFDYTVLFFIALNCITLAMERPDIPSKSIERKFLNFSNYAFTVIFTFEMVVKVTAKGLVIGKGTYLRSGWNVMDGFLVFISLLDIAISSFSSSSPRIFGILRVFRLLRTLRPLRVISRAPGLKLVVQTLLSSLRPIGNIVLICCTFFIIFGILGVQLFKGKFYHCEGGDVSDIKNYTDCINKGPPYRWVNHKYNFDNIGQALMALFVLASKDGWVNIMYTGLDAVGVNQQPQVNYSEWRLLFFISFLLLVGFFVLNMFVGVVVENFHKCRENQEKEERARRAAKRAKKLEKKRRSMDSTSTDISKVKLQLEMRVPPYWSNYSKPRLFLHETTSSKYFDLAIAGVIGLNVVTMAMECYMMPRELEFALKIFNYFFTSVFILELIIKVAAMSLFRYIKDRWNQLDLLIVILSIVGIMLEEMESGVIPVNPTIIRVMRVLRIARVLKLLKMAKGIRALLDTVIQALPQVGNLGLLFFLLFFIFAALGVELFGRLECSERRPCEGLSKHAHFRNFGMAFLTLFRVATGDNWNGIMKDTLREKCDSSDDCEENCCVSPIIAPVFFVVFVLMAQFVLVNVVVAVLMKHLEESNKQLDDDAELEMELQRELEGEFCKTIDDEKDEQSQTDSPPDSKEPSEKENISEEPAQSGITINIDGDASDVENEAGGALALSRDKVDKMEEVEKDAPRPNGDSMSLLPPTRRRIHKPVQKQSSLPPNFTFNINHPASSTPRSLRESQTSSPHPGEILDVSRMSSYLEPPKIYDPTVNSPSHSLLTPQITLPKILCKPPTPRPLRPIPQPPRNLHTFKRQDAVTSNSSSPLSTPGILSPLSTPGPVGPRAENSFISVKNTGLLTPTDKISLCDLSKNNLTNSENILSNTRVDEKSKQKHKKALCKKTLDLQSSSQPLLWKQNLSCDFPDDLKAKSSSQPGCDKNIQLDNGGYSPERKEPSFGHKSGARMRQDTVSCSDEVFLSIPVSTVMYSDDLDSPHSVLYPDVFVDVKDPVVHLEQAQLDSTHAENDQASINNEDDWLERACDEEIQRIVNQVDSVPQCSSQSPQVNGSCNVFSKNSDTLSRHCESGDVGKEVLSDASLLPAARSYPSARCSETTDAQADTVKSDLEHPTVEVIMPRFNSSTPSSEEQQIRHRKRPASERTGMRDIDPHFTPTNTNPK